MSQASAVSAAAVVDASLVAAPGAGKQIRVNGGFCSVLAASTVSLSSNVIAGVKEVATIDRGTSTGGTWAMTVGAATDAAIAFNVSAANLKTAVEALAGVTTVTVTGTGTVGDPWIVTFDDPVAPLAVSGDGTNLTGGDATLTVTETTQGIAVDEGLRWRAYQPATSEVSIPGPFSCADNEALYWTSTATTSKFIAVDYEIVTTTDLSG